MKSGWKGFLKGAANFGIGTIAQLAGIPLGVLGIRVPMNAEFGAKKPQQQTDAPPAEAQLQTQVGQPLISQKAQDAWKAESDDLMAQAAALEEYRRTDQYKNLPEDQRTKAEELYMGERAVPPSENKWGIVLPPTDPTRDKSRDKLKEGEYIIYPGSDQIFRKPGPDDVLPADGKQRINPVSKLTPEQIKELANTSGYEGIVALTRMGGNEFQNDAAGKNFLKSIAQWRMNPADKEAAILAAQEGSESFNAWAKDYNAKHQKEIDAGTFVRILERGENELPAPEPEPEPESEKPQKPEKPSTPAPDYAEVEKVQQAVTGALSRRYEGLDINKRTGQRGMGKGDGDINAVMHTQEEQAYQKAQAEIEQNKQFERAIKTGNLRTELQLQTNGFLNRTQYMDDAERETEYNAFVQQLLLNPNISPNASGLSNEDKADRFMALQDTINRAAIGTQDSMMQYNREKLISDTSNNLEAITEMVGRGEGKPEENWGLAATQLLNVKNSMPPAQFSRLAASTAASIIGADVQRTVQTKIQEAAEQETLVDVNEVLQGISDDGGAGYFALLNLDSIDGPSGSSNALRHIYQTSFNNTIIEARKALQGYNEDLIKQRQGTFEVWNNEGMYPQAKAFGEEWRDTLENAYYKDGRKAGNISDDFYYASRDFFKPNVIKEESAASHKSAAGRGINGVGERIIQYYQNNRQGETPYQILIDAYDNFTAPIGEEDQYYDKNENGEYVKGQKLHTLIRNQVIEELYEKFKNTGTQKSVAFLVPRIQELFVEVDKLDEYLRREYDKNEGGVLGIGAKNQYKNIVNKFDGTNDGTKNQKLEPKELERLAESMNNIMFGAIYDEWERKDMPNHATEEKFLEWRLNLRKRAMSGYLQFILPGTDAQAGIRGNEFRPDSETIADMTRGLMDISNSPEFFGDAATSQLGRASADDKSSFIAYRDTIVTAMNNLNKSDSLHAGDIITMPLLQTSMDDTRKGSRTDAQRFLGKGQDAFDNFSFKLADTRAKDTPIADLISAGNIKDGQPYLEAGGYIFVLEPDGKKVNAKVYGKDVNGAVVEDIIGRGKNAVGNKAVSTRLF